MSQGKPISQADFPQEIIDRLLLATGLKTQASLASYLGITPPKITGAFRRGHVPALWLYKVAYETGCRLEWLQKGEEPRNRAESHAAIAPKLVTLALTYPGLLQAWNDLGEEGRNVMSDYFSLWNQDEEIRNYLASQRNILRRVRPQRKA
ncbi:MAG: hypothetical protein BVN29_11435 [Nitrospira sp. ST-bin5]|nr:MAG: hypothetical protein BVN29_11435 [Nitrospira sp. ST-bin5]